MATTLRYEGHTLEITTEAVDVTPMEEPDPKWTFTDAAGHRHYWSDTESGGPYPTLEYRTRHDHEHDDEECDADGEQEFCYPVLCCKKCSQAVSPGSRPVSSRRVVPGLRTYLIDGEPVSKQAAEDFLAARRAERLASGQICRRCEQPLGDDPHVCQGMVRSPVIETLVRGIQANGLMYELTRLVGRSAAKRMIREARTED